MTGSDPRALVAQDFAAYEEKRQRDPEFNGFRLIVRRKLDAYGKEAQKYLKQEKELALACRTSLNHPHSTNRMRVASQIAYLSRADKDKRDLNARFGPALAQDVDTHYIQTTLSVMVDAQGFEQALRVHALAWWDGQNLKNRVRTEAELDLFGDLVNGLPAGFVLLMDSWKLEYRAGQIGPEDLERYFKSYTPGDHWLHLRRRLSAEQAIQLGLDLSGYVREGFLALADVYRFIAWSPDNDWLFDENGRIRR